MIEHQQRRLAAILAADIAGYSALMGANEEATVRDLKAHQAVVLPMIGEQGGRIIDTAGDGILAEFASVVGAVRAAPPLVGSISERRRLQANTMDTATSLRGVKTLQTEIRRGARSAGQELFSDRPNHN
jgi:class 3 adenylate cyclase